LSFLSSSVKSLLGDATRTVNFVPHSAPLGTCVEEWVSQEYEFSKMDRGCSCVSAGVLDHASTNYAAMSAVFEFLEAGCQEGSPRPNSPQIEHAESVHGIDSNACLAEPVFEGSESNNILSNARFEDNPFAAKPDAALPTNAPNNYNVKHDSQWARLKYVLQGVRLPKRSSKIVAL